MRSILKTLLLLTVTLLFANCRKGYTNVIEGNVYYQGSGLPVMNAKIVIGEDHNANTEFPIAATTTDNNGYFKVNFNRHIYRSYRQFLNVKTDSLEAHQRITDKKEKVNVYL